MSRGDTVLHVLLEVAFLNPAGFTKQTGQSTACRCALLSYYFNVFCDSLTPVCCGNTLALGSSMDFPWSSPASPFQQMEVTARWPGLFT